MSKEDSIKKAHKIMEDTKYEQEKYRDERKLIFSFLQDIKEDDVKKLELIENIYIKIRELEEENNKYDKIKTLLVKLRNQEIRKTDNDKIMHLFLLTDVNNNKYSFFTRESANEYKKEHIEEFDKNIEIEVSKIRNIDLEKIINIIN